jgi:hypothetical protein
MLSLHSASFVYLNGRICHPVTALCAAHASSLAAHRQQQQQQQQQHVALLHSLQTRS